MSSDLDLRFALRHALDPLGELGRVCDLHEAQALAGGLDDQVRLGQVLAIWSTVRGE